MSSSRADVMFKNTFSLVVGSLICMNTSCKNNKELIYKTLRLLSLMNIKQSMKQELGSRDPLPQSLRRPELLLPVVT